MKRISAALLAGAIMVTATGCDLQELGKKPIRVESEAEASVEDMSVAEPVKEEVKEEASEAATVEEAEEIVEEEEPEEDLLTKYKNNPMDLTPGELFRLFCQGEIMAETLPDESGNTHTIDASYYEFEDFTDATSAMTVKKPLDLDNDGELEFIINNMVYGDMYFDCKDGKVVCFAQGEGTEIKCTNQYYNGANWVIHYGSAGNGTAYIFDKYNGNLGITESFRLDAIDEADGTRSYYKDETPISADEYVVLRETIFGYDREGMMEGEELTKSELKDYEAFLERDGYVGFTFTTYRQPEDVNWGSVLYGGAGIDTDDYSVEAKDAYLKAIGEEYVEYDLAAYKGDDVRADIERKTGLVNFDLKKIRGLVYVEEYDMCFLEYSDVTNLNVTILKGVKNGPVVQLVIEGRYGEPATRLTLIGTGDSANPFHFYSNRQLWEEEYGNKTFLAPVDGSDEMVEYVVSSSVNVHDGCTRPHIQIIEGNEAGKTVGTWMENVDLAGYEIKEVLFCEVNGDDIGDAILILDDGSDTIAVVSRGKKNEYGSSYYYCDKYTTTEWLGKNIKNLTATRVLKYIKSHQDEYKELIK
nr:hypothetical protein [uncultured Butyrivibrio sp.]